LTAVGDDIAIPDGVCRPHAPTGLDEVALGESILFSVEGGLSNAGFAREYRFAWFVAPFDWNNPDSLSPWSPDSTVSFTWQELGEHKVKAQTRSAHDTTVVSAWSAYKRVTVQ